MTINHLLLKVNSITKKFTNITAVNNLSFSISRGQIFALLGPNGAGKTTVVRMLMDIIKPDSGTIEYYFPPNSSVNYKSTLLGYLPEERGLYQEIPIIKSLVYLGVIRGLDKTTAKDSAEKWLEKLELHDRRNDKLSTLSKGNQQKVQFISSILHNPLFAILDEPFSGFDPINQELFISIIKELSQNGTTILLSAHQMYLVEKIADKVLLLNNGSTIAFGTVESIKKEFSAEEIIFIKTTGKPEIDFLQNEKSIKTIELMQNNEMKIIIKNQSSLSGLLNKISSNFEISSIRTENISLHEIFIELVKKNQEE
ncbi:MAG: ATP-binding cassette domain-containing protein [bacterium]